MLRPDVAADNVKDRCKPGQEEGGCRRRLRSIDRRVGVASVVCRPSRLLLPSCRSLHYFVERAVKFASLLRHRAISRISLKEDASQPVGLNGRVSLLHGNGT